MSNVERYLHAVAAQNWLEAADCLAPDVRRVGPFGDVYEGREPYLAFLRGLMPTLAGYEMAIHRVVPSADGPVTAVELSETVVVDAGPVVTPECLIFDLGPDGRIRVISIYIGNVGVAGP